MIFMHLASAGFFCIHDNKIDVLLISKNICVTPWLGTEGAKDMRLHLVPKIFNKYADVTAELVSVEVPEIGLTLVAGIDIVTRRPYPNKAYHVACRKKGRKAITGLFVDVEEHLANFTVSTTWKVNKKRYPGAQGYLYGR